ncbi:MAG TPA: aerial mycelium formation protein, partial [Actinomycetota bacterium]|nr:aerial mycelium formation protein [Actinomycetota bacterium]
MTEPVMAGGHRRIDRVMDPMFLDGLGDARIEELRRRRDECRAEIEYLSYLRRLLQGRLDILRAERGQRESGAAGSLVDRLPEILSGGGATGSRGAFVHVVLPDEEMALARRHVERLVSDAGLSDLPALSDAAL